MQALTLFEPGELNSFYPFEMDGTSRLHAPGKAQGPEVSRWELGERTAARDGLLQEARDWFDRARTRDRLYAPAWINLACIADLQNEPDEAALWAQQAVKVARHTDEATALAHARIIAGIVRLHGVPPDEARARITSIPPPGSRCRSAPRVRSRDDC